MDTGSSVDILPYDDYVRATDDNQCEKLENTNIRLVMHNKSVVKPMGLAHLQVHGKDAQRQVRFIVVRDKVVPLLSLQWCLDLDLIKINDCDAINAVVMQKTNITVSFVMAANTRRRRQRCHNERRHMRNRNRK